jgi:hypothetical protein
MAAAYLTVFAHCLMRLVYSRLPSWLLYTTGFCGLSCMGILGVVGNTHLMADDLQREWLDVFRSALIPGSAALLLFAAHASRIRAREHRTGIWKTYLRVALFVVAIVLVWKSGGG